MANKPSLPAFERLVATRQLPEALQMALGILGTIDKNYGGLKDIIVATNYPSGNEEENAVVFATRFAAAFGRLFTDPALKISAASFERLSAQHRWVDLVFSLSGFGSSDNFIPLLANDAGNGQLSFEGGNVLRLLVMLTMNSVLNVDFDKFWRANRTASAVAFLNHLRSRYVFSRRALEFRERLLEWMPPHLAEVKLGSLMLARLHDAYMHCSYAFTAKKHAIKRALMEQMRRACLEAGVVEAASPLPARREGRATVVVVGEQFVEGHATFRCFAPAVQSLRERFNLVGIIYPDPVGTQIASYFDECFSIPAGDAVRFPATVRALAAELVARKPALIWYLGVGMLAEVIALASLRLAPIQCASIGHNASTMSPMMDYFILPEDWIASRECFSEEVLPVPKAAMPFSRRSVPNIRRQPADGIVRVAIAASIMKLNHVLFETIARIAAGAKKPCEFHFFTGAATGLAYFELARTVRARVRRATLHRHSPYERYMEGLARCDLFLSAFPHGGMTSIMDTFQLGMPGVCLDGAEPHAHADAAIFARIGLPAELIAKSLDEYVAAAIKLIDNETWRCHCSAIVRGADLDAAFFTGNPRLFSAAIEKLIWPQST